MIGWWRGERVKRREEKVVAGTGRNKRAGDGGR